MYAAEHTHLLVTLMEEDLTHELKCRSYRKVFLSKLAVLSLKILQPEARLVCIGSQPITVWRLW
jgi:hypothetical protein